MHSFCVKKQTRKKCAAVKKKVWWVELTLPKKTLPKSTLTPKPTETKVSNITTKLENNESKKNSQKLEKKKNTSK